MNSALRAGLAVYLTPAQIELLEGAHIAIAGAGGLGSNVAMMLARSGICKMTIADCDTLEPSNLNRQHYWPRQLGMPKVNAIAEHLRELNPDLELTLHHTLVTEANVNSLFQHAPIWVEALDDPAAKKLVVEAGLLRGAQVAAASGLAGFGGMPMHKKRLGNLCLVGDFTTDISQAPPLAPRVTQAAALLADCVLEFILR